MRDSIGGVANLVIIVVFLTLVSGLLAFNVNYTKAFRVKNKIISTFEQYEGKCELSVMTDKCTVEILDYMEQLGYSSTSDLIDMEDPYHCQYNFCYKKMDIDPVVGSAIEDTKKRAYFKVVTIIEMDIPIINKILPQLHLFQVSGDTKPIVLAE